MCSVDPHVLDLLFERTGTGGGSSRRRRTRRRWGRFGATFGRGRRWAIGGVVAGLEESLGRPLNRRKPGPPAGRKGKRR